MKFDLHCHTKEGSLDSKVSILKYISEYRKLGYDGFMICDHNSYRGCIAWDKLRSLPELEEDLENFTVIRGVEYDTKDAGHVLVVLPDGVYDLRCTFLWWSTGACPSIRGGIFFGHGFQ